MEESMVVGLIPAPELPADMAERLADELPQAFSDNINRAIEWKIRLYYDPLTGAAENIDKICNGLQPLNRRKTGIIRFV